MSNENKLILHLCAGIGSDSAPYKDAGYDVQLITKEIGVENYHPPKNVYGIIANPPCTEFSFAKTTGTPRNMREGMKLVKECLRIIWEAQYDLEGAYSKKTTLKFWMLENPKGLLESFLGKPAFQYSPWEFGDNYKKQTQIWGKFICPDKLFYDENRKLPKFDRLKTKEIHPEFFGKMTRQERRSICSAKFAEAFFKANK